MKNFGTCTKSFGNILDLQKESSHTDRNITTQTWQNQPKSVLCRVSNALENHGPITNAPAYPCKTIVNTHRTRRRHAVDVVSELPPSGGYQKIVTVMDVFERYLFAYLKTSQDARTVARVKFSIMPKHGYLPTTIISDKASAFVTQVIKEVVDVL